MQGEADSPVRVVVTPSQSSYFAGEPFSVTVTFTNTRSPEAGPSKPSGSAHKRGAHSISSAPLARPPTSPGTPRSTLNAPTLCPKVDEFPRRKGLIGKTKPPLNPSGTEDLPDLIEQRRKKQLAPKALSVSISPFELGERLAEGAVVSSAPHAQSSFFHDTRQVSAVPHTSSPLARTDTLPLAANHPHARKQSVFDGRSSLDVLSPTTSVPPSPYSSTSTFSLVLDPIAEATFSPYPSTPTIGLPTIEPVNFAPPHATVSNTSSGNSVYAYPLPRQSKPSHQRPSPIGLGQPSNSQHLHAPPRTAFASTFSQPNNELILYSYAQLTGAVVIAPPPGFQPSSEQTRTLNILRSALLNRSVLGGGSMDITSSLHPPSPVPPSSLSPKPRHKATHSRTSSFSSGFLTILSPSSLLSSSTPNSPSSATFSSWATSGKRRSLSSTFTPLPSPGSAKFPGSSSSPSVLGLGLHSGHGYQEGNPEEPLPSFEVQPAMLAVDLSLAPGESRSYTYSIKLPENLPPTFKGKSLAFSYELVVGTCRAGPPGTGGAVSANSISRVMKVPIRVYNHVCVGRTLKPYDLLSPVNKRMDVGIPGMDAKVVENTDNKNIDLLRLPSFSPSSTGNTLESLKEYANSLLASLPDAGQSNGATFGASSPIHMNGGANGKHNGNSTSHDHVMALHQMRESEREREDAGLLTGCREAVEILTRISKKASYDVNKDGVKVAVLTFTKSAYRLGETVCGIVELNEWSSRSRVLKLSAILESHETLPSTISPTSAARHLRRSHAEHHSSFTLNTLRTTFTLDIPSDASPAFQIRVGTPVDGPGTTQPTPGGLEWKVRLCLLVGIAAESSYAGHQGARFKSLIRDGPRGEWGSSWRATSTDAPLEKPNPKAEQLDQRQRSETPVVSAARSWSQFLVSSLLYATSDPAAEGGYHDGDVEDDADEVDELAEGYDGIIADPAGGVGVGVDYAGGEEGWRGVKLETVECEVPVRVYPGNTAFRALDVVFDV